MKNFAFRLDTVLRWRQTRLAAERAGLLRIQGQIADLQRDCEARRETLDAEREQLKIIGPPAFPAWNTFALRAESTNRTQIARIASASSELSAARRRTAEARRGVEVIEKLKARELSKWQAEMSQEIEADAADSFLSRLQSGSGRARSSSG